MKACFQPLFVKLYSAETLIGSCFPPALEVQFGSHKSKPNFPISTTLEISFLNAARMMLIVNKDKPFAFVKTI